MEAENRVKGLEEEMRKLKQQLEEERSKNTRLEAELDYRKRNGLDKELTEEETKNVSILAEYKAEIKELTEKVQHRDNQIMELLDLNGQQAEENIDNKMTIIDLQYRTRAELECETVNRLRDQLTK